MNKIRIILFFTLIVSQVSAQKYVKTIILDSLERYLGETTGYIPETNEFYWSYNDEIRIYDGNSGQKKQQIYFSQLNNCHISQIAAINFINGNYYILDNFGAVLYVVNSRFFIQKTIHLDKLVYSYITALSGQTSSFINPDNETILMPCTMRKQNLYVFKELNVNDLSIDLKFKNPYLESVPILSQISFGFTCFLHPRYGVLIVFPYNSSVWSYSQQKKLGNLASVSNKDLKIQILKDKNDIQEANEKVHLSTYIIQTGYVPQTNHIFRITVLPATNKAYWALDHDYLLSVYSSNLVLLSEKKIIKGKYLPFAYANKNGFYLLKGKGDVLSLDLFYL